jgi:hypothetical protein
MEVKKIEAASARMQIMTLLLSNLCASKVPSGHAIERFSAAMCKAEAVRAT